MDFMTAAVLSGIAYDTLKKGLTFTTILIKSELKDWIIDDKTAEAVSKELNTLKLTDELSEKAIERKIIESTNLQGLIEKIKPCSEGNIIIQNHSGSGDNIGRDKIVHKK